VPEHLDTLVAALLEKDPSKRPQSAAEVKASLERFGERDAGTAALTTEPLTIPELTRRLPPPKRSSAAKWLGAAAALSLLGLLALVPVLFAGGGERSPMPSPDADSPAASAATDPADEPTEPPPGQPGSLRDAARAVFDEVSAGVAAGQVSGGIVGEIQRKIDELLREFDKGQPVERSIEKIAELRTKLKEALEKDEITSHTRMRAIDDALADFTASLQEARS
jgi:hypothetical protein